MKRAKGGCGTIDERTRYGSVSGTYVDRRQSESCTGIRLLGLQSDVDAWAVPKTDNMRFRGATSGAEVGWEIEPTKSLPGGVQGVPRFPFLGNSQNGGQDISGGRVGLYKHAQLR